jgi:hypothetical protein
MPSGGNTQLAAAGAPAVQAAVQTALNGLRAQGVVIGADLALPAPISAPASAPVATVPPPLVATSPLTPEILNKIVRYIALSGIDRETAAVLANPLGLSASGQTWASRQVAVEDSQNHYTHGFAVSRGTDQDIYLSKRLPDSIHAFRATRDGKVVGALFAIPSTGQVSMRDPAEAQAEFDDEAKLWADNIDALLAGK